MDGGREWRSQLGKWEANHIFFQIGGLPILANQFMLMVFSTIERR